MGVEIIQEPKQHQLVIRLWIEPQFDRLASRADLEKSEVLDPEFFERPRLPEVQPMIIRLLIRARFEEGCKLRLGRQRSPDESAIDRNRNIREVSLLEVTRSGRITGHNQAGHTG